MCIGALPSGPLTRGQNPESRQQKTKFRELLCGTQAVSRIAAYPDSKISARQKSTARAERQRSEEGQNQSRPRRRIDEQEHGKQGERTQCTAQQPVARAQIAGKGFRLPLSIRAPVLSSPADPNPPPPPHHQL